MSLENEDHGFTLSKVVKDVSQHSTAQTEALRDKQKTLQSLEITLSDVKNKCKQAEVELRSKVRMLLGLESDIELLEQQTQVLFDHCTSISRDNLELERCIKEEEENALATLAVYNTYRTKMEDYRAAVLLVAHQTETHKELEEKRAQVRMLNQKKGELKEDLQNPNGNAVQMAKRETNALKEQIITKKKTIAEKRARLQRESEMHVQMKKDIEIQSRRYDAIVKRLHCQLSKAQAVHRQVSAEINHMERQLHELKGQLETCPGSVVRA